MSVSVNATKLTNLVNPEVIGNLLDKKLFDAIKFAPLCTIDTTLEGQPGNTIKLPYWKAIATAQITAEGEAVTINKLEGDTAQATIAKLTNGVELTDEAVLSGYGDPVGQAVEQLAKSIADAVDTDLADLEEYVYEDEKMDSVMKKFETTSAWNLPVVRRADRSYLGFVSKSMIFSAYRDELKIVSQD